MTRAIRRPVRLRAIARLGGFGKRAAFAPLLEFVALGLFVLAPAAASAQEYSIGALREAHTFADPAGVGIERSWVQAVVLTARVPLGTSFVAGTRATHGSVSIEGPSGGVGELSGLADTEVWLGLDLDRFALTGSYWLPTGQTSLTAGASAARGLSSDLFLRYPLVPWGGGGRMALEASTRFGPRFAAFELRAGVASHGSYRPLLDDSFEYAPGSELFGDLAVAADLGGLTSLGLMVGVRRIGADQVGSVDVYEPGVWVDAALTLTTQVGMTSVMGTIAYLSRGAAVASQLDPGDGFRDPDLVFGAWATPMRQLLDTRIDFRRALDWGDVLVGIGARLSENDGSRSSLVTLDAGLEREVAVVRTGRLLVRPVVRAGSGNAVVSPGFESGVRHLGGSVTLSWMR